MYTPDAWVIVRINLGDEVIDKVLAGWHGGYLGADSWKLNSGIVNVNEFEDHYEFEGHSGSVYWCAKGAERLTTLTGGIFSSLKKMAELRGQTAEIIPVEVLTNPEAPAR